MTGASTGGASNFQRWRLPFSPLVHYCVLNHSYELAFLFFLWPSCFQPPLFAIIQTCIVHCLLSYGYFIAQSCISHLLFMSCWPLLILSMLPLTFFRIFSKINVNVLTVHFLLRFSFKWSWSVQNLKQIVLGCYGFCIFPSPRGAGRISFLGWKLNIYISKFIYKNFCFAYEGSTKNLPKYD